MLNCLGKPKPDKTNTTESIDKKIKKEKKQFLLTHRIPVVGAGESGKSTLIKQMQILYIDGFSHERKMQMKQNIKRNCCDALLSILFAMERISPPVALEYESNQELKDYLFTINTKENYDFPPIFFEYCEKLWADKGVQQCFARSHEYQIIDSAQFFLSKVMKIGSEDFIPDNQDILRCRELTSGIFETKFTMNKINFHMFDVGGQRDERRKWIQVFHDVTAVIFVCATSAYDMTLRELATQNRLRESIDLFKEVWNNRFLRQNSMILFLNKQDMFTEKIMKGHTKLETYFPDYVNYPQPRPHELHSDCSPELLRAMFYVRDQFVVITKQNNGETSRRCYPHFTTAVDTENIKRVFIDCQDMLQRIYMQKIGLM